MNPQDFFGTSTAPAQPQTVSANDFFAPSASTPTPTPAPYSGGFKQDLKDFGGEVSNSFQNPTNFVTDTLRGLVDPTYKAQSVVGGIAQNTIGSRGAIGAAELPGRAIVAKITAGSDQHVAESKMQLAETTLHLIHTMNGLPDGPQKAQLQQTIADNQNILGLASNQLDELAKHQVTSGQALGNSINTATLAFGSGSAGASAKLLPRMAEGAAIGAASDIGSNLSDGQTPSLKGVAGAAALGAAVPFAGTMLSKLKQGVGGGIETLGQKIQTSVIRPTTHDIEDGFKVETLKKYDLGGSLNTTLKKTNALMNDLGAKLKTLAAGSDAKINLEDVYAETAKELSGGGAKTFGQNGRIENILGELEQEVKRVAPNGPVDLSTSQDVKRAAGTMGSWVYGFGDKDATATEAVYTAFYRNLRKAIEGTDAGPEMKAINQQLQELIPVHNAVIRRIPVAERQNAISLTDVMGLIGTAIDPKAAPIAILNKASKSGRVGAALTDLGAKIKNVVPSITNVGKRIFGK